MLGIPHPYLTPSLPGIGGVSKSRPEDFVVEEVPLYTPCGRGEHTYFGVEKIDLSTPEAIERLRRALDVPAKEIGYGNSVTYFGSGGASSPAGVSCPVNRTASRRNWPRATVPSTSDLLAAPSSNIPVGWSGQWNFGCRAISWR